jgi:hypothetical protein
MGEAPLRHGSAATSSASMMSQSDLSKMQYDGSAPTIATRQLPRSGFVQVDLCGAQDYAELRPDRAGYFLTDNNAALSEYSRSEHKHLTGLGHFCLTLMGLCDSA